MPRIAPTTPSPLERSGVATEKHVSLRMNIGGFKGKAILLKDKMTY